MIENSDAKDRRDVLAQLTEADGVLTSSAIEAETGLGQWSVFLVAMDLLAAGQPICFGNSEGAWLNFTESDNDVDYWMAEGDEDLVSMKEIVEKQGEYLMQIRSGIAKARRGLKAQELVDSN